MVFVIVLLTITVFVAVDLTLRLALARIEEARVQRERAKALDVGLRLDFAEEATSLRRVTVDEPKARILAVDDEPVVLDSLRKILVLDGYSIDTVETGQEALSMIRQHEYDFVFTDLKMPGMTGIDVIKAVKHLRPDVDVVVITGYATIESAVETMKFGALDYVQKPFTADELAQFVAKLVFRRQDRLEGRTPLEIRLVTTPNGESPVAHVVNVPGGVYVSPQHAWVSVGMTGEAIVGLDDFAHKTMGEADSLDLPEIGSVVHRGDPLFTIHRGENSLTFSAPVSGRVSRVNHELLYRLDLLRIKPYDFGWICAVDPSQLSIELRQMRIGAEAISWYESEIEKYQRALHEVGGDRAAVEIDGESAAEPDDRIETRWSAFGTTFLREGPEMREEISEVAR